MIDINLNFSTDGLVENLSFVLARKDTSKIGLLSNPQEVTASVSCEEAPSISVKFYKVDNPYWDDINMFKLIYVPEQNTYYSIECETSEGDGGKYKALTITRMAETELELINVYGLQINTEEEIITPDYDSNFPNVLYRDPEDIEAYDDIWNSDEKYAEYTDEQKSDVLRHSSILHRVLSFAPHYSIGHVDESIQNIQRIFTFDGTNVHECLNQIAEEMSIIFDFNGRTVNAYDALASCDDCGYRGHFTGTCPNCGGSNITEGFGENTGICIGADALGTNLTYQRNAEAISNCYHVVGGDDIMTAAIRNCNPNGGYVWSFSDEMKSEMSSGLRTALNTYENLYNDYQTDHVFDVSSLPLAAYNALIAKYKALDTDVKIDTISSITGYSELIKAYYDAIDFGEYLNNGLYPSITNNGKTAAQVVAGLTDNTLSPVSLIATEGLTLSSASSAVVSYARILSDPLYDIKVVSQELVTLLGGYQWVGVLSATNYYDKDDNAKTGTLHIVINSDIENYAQNSVKQTLLNRSKGNAEIINLYSMTDVELANALQYYSYQALSSINDCYVKSVEMLTNIGAQDEENDAHTIYTTTQAKLAIITAELALRENEVKVVDFKDSTTSMVALLTDMINTAKATMKIENNLTSLQWVELNAFRRESDYSNDNYVSTSFRKKFDYVDSNYISDALSNAELIKRAYEFLLMAEYKIRENNKYSYQINTTLQNLLAIPEFEGLRDGFKVGNWLRVMDSSGQLYKLRLMKYEVDFNDLSTISVEFADVSLNNSTMNKMQKFMLKTQDVVDKFGKSENQNNSNLVNKSGDISNDYNYSDAYTGGESYQSIEIMGNQMTTKFNILDGLIQGKISAAQAMSLIAQELGKITLKVQNGEKVSTITIKYDGVDISTSDAITLGGTVIFSDNLTDGETIISGDNILTGEIKSANYYFRDGQIFSDHGSLFDLIYGVIRTPHLYSDEDGLHIKGTIYADAGYIGEYPILTAGGSSALDHSHSAWKLRSAPIAAQNGERYYVSLTKNRNLVVSNSKDGAHTADNDRTDECNIGTRNYPWRYGYFRRAYTVYDTINNGVVKHNSVLLGTEYVKVTLAGDSWDNNDRQTVNIVGITKDQDVYDKVKQWVEVVPAYADAVKFFNMGIVIAEKKAGQLVFEKLMTMESSVPDVTVFIYVTYAKPKNDRLNEPYNASVTYDSDEDTTYVIWEDPDDEMFAIWDRSILVRKKDTEPDIEYDQTNNQWVLNGATKLTEYTGEENRSKYLSNNPFIDNDPIDGIQAQTKGKYYYKIYCMTSEYNLDSYYVDTINTSDAPVINSVVLTSDGGAITYDLFPGFYSSIKVVCKVGEDPEDEDDGDVVLEKEDYSVEEFTSEFEEINGTFDTGELHFCIFVVMDDADKQSNVYTLVNGVEYRFDYTGQIQQFVVPATGLYQLEAWGAQGACTELTEGGYGAYSCGTVELQKDDVVYIVVGGQNGYNGGAGINIVSPIISDLNVDIFMDVTVDYFVEPLVTHSYDSCKLVVKKNSAPTSVSDGDKVIDLSPNDTSITVDGLDEESHYYFKIFIVDGLGNAASSNVMDITTEDSLGAKFTFTGDVQEYNVPRSGIYQIETWGAQGSNAYNDNDVAKGGYGSYAVGEVLLSDDDTIYVTVGGQNGYNSGGLINWNGAEIPVMWSGENNKMTVRYSNSTQIFRLYIGTNIIYEFTAQATDQNNINIGFIIDNTNQIAKPSLIYDNGNDTYTYNAESPTTAEMELIYQWLHPHTPAPDLVLDEWIKDDWDHSSSNFVQKSATSAPYNGTFSSAEKTSGKNLAKTDSLSYIFTYDTENNCLKTTHSGQYSFYAMRLDQPLENVDKITFDVKIVGSGYGYLCVECAELVGDTIRETRYAWDRAIGQVDDWTSATIYANSGVSTSEGYTYYHLEDFANVTFINFEISGTLTAYIRNLTIHFK